MRSYILLILIFAATNLSSCEYFRKKIVCSQMNGDIACNSNTECQLGQGVCVADVGLLPKECGPQCVGYGNGCREKDGSNLCVATWRDETKSQSSNSDITGCRANGSDPARCELKTLNGGTKVCDYVAGRNPCDGCKLAPGACLPRSHCSSMICFD